MKTEIAWASPEEIPDEVIEKTFNSVQLVVFSARRFNYIQYRKIGFSTLGWWLPLERVLQLIGVTPQMLRSVFSPQRKWENKKLIEIELPEVIETYEQLGNFPLSDKPFLELSKILGKSIKVFRENGGTGEHYHLFTVKPSGEIIEAED